MNCIVDTNILLNDIGLEEYEIIYVPITVLEELDKLKTYDDSDKAFKARCAIRKLIELKDKIKYSSDREKENLFLEDTPDNRIINVAYYIQNHIDENAIILSQDLNVIEKCRALELKVKEYNDYIEKEIYKGYKKIFLNQEELAYLYEHLDDNIYELLINEYLIIYDNDKTFISVIKWSGEKHVNLSYNKMNNNYIDEIKPKDEIQQCAFDALFNSNIICLTGKQGTGKTLLSLGTALTLLKKEKCRKIWIVASNVPLKGAFDIGYRTGDTVSKNLQLQIGKILSTKMGGDEAILSLIMLDRLEIINLIDIRGVEFGDGDAVVITESQNLSTYHIKTILSRCKSGCKIICEGDILDQRDVRNDCGVLRMIDVFKGNRVFSTIKLETNYRSEFAELLDKL